MEVPPGLAVDRLGLVCKLNKSLYGLKQASRQWYEKLTEAFCSREYTHSLLDYSLFYKKYGTSVVFVAVYVDDVLVTRTDLQEIEALAAYLHKTFKIMDMGRPHYFLGLEILYKDDGYSALTSPLDPSSKLSVDEGSLLPDPSHFRKLVGKLNYLTNTRLDISNSVQHLSQYMQSPREPHLKVAYHVLRYLKGDPNLGIFLSNKQDYKIRAFCDLDWAACPDLRKSVSGYVVLLGDGPIGWKSKKQHTISLSLAEVEYRAARQVVGELVWLLRLLIELTPSLTVHVPIFCDSQASLHIAKNPVFYERTKHIEVDCHFVRGQVHEGLITLHYISTNEQLAYIFTKPLTGMKHCNLRSKLAVSSSLPT
ncbi:PREDICTED: uncharacterized protein LOC109228093 [Nicotiana attenuata]|uniref:uncharacterized protein LOC109228093 n=1 Tax=Nicotiana attenuata TaxID=49451 RepID=UPI0009046EEC|nr:PREDICTED: uncharacterized protein LOC109228093 [Nicotiana attenuata]